MNLGQILTLTHELEMTRLKELESTEKRSRSLALKSKVAETESSENSSEENSENENLNLLVRRFNRFIKLKNRSKNQQNKRYSKKSDSSFIKLTCFGCGKTGHMKADCPNLQTWISLLKGRITKLEKPERLT